MIAPICDEFRGRAVPRVFAVSSIALLSGLFVGVWIHWSQAGKSGGPPQQDDAAMSVVVYPSEEVLLDRQSREAFDVEFALHNPGDEAIVLEDIQTSCLCTSAELSSRVIEPRRFVLLRVGISDLTGYVTSFRQHVEVRTKSGSIRVTVAGELPSPTDILFRPQRLARTINGAPDDVSSIVVRVPKGCCDVDDVTERTCKFPTDVVKDVAIEFSGGSAVYWDYRVKVEWNDAPRASEEQALEITLPCGTVRIPIDLRVPAAGFTTSDPAVAGIRER